jgi:hypothetical protein
LWRTNRAVRPTRSCCARRSGPACSGQALLLLLCSGHSKPQRARPLRSGAPHLQSQGCTATVLRQASRWLPASPVQAENRNSPPTADGRSHRCCAPPKGKGDVSTAIIDPNGTIETLNCPTPAGDLTLSFGEEAGVVTPEGTSAIREVAAGAAGVEGTLAVAGFAARLG